MFEYTPTIFRFDPQLLKLFIEYLDSLDRDDYISFNANIETSKSICKLIISFNYNLGDIENSESPLFGLSNSFIDLTDSSDDEEPTIPNILKPINDKFNTLLTVICQYLENIMYEKAGFGNPHKTYDSDFENSDSESDKDEAFEEFRRLENSKEDDDLMNSDDFLKEFTIVGRLDESTNINATLGYPPLFINSPPFRDYIPQQSVDFNVDDIYPNSLDPYECEYKLIVEFKTSDIYITQDKTSSYAKYLQLAVAQDKFAFDLSRRYRYPGTVFGNLDNFIFSFFTPLIAH